MSGGGMGHDIAQTLLRDPVYKHNASRGGRRLKVSFGRERNRVRCCRRAQAQ